MQADGKNTKATTDATIKQLETVQQRLWAILGLKMALDKLKEFGYEVTADSKENGAATITINFGLIVDLGSGTVNGKDIVASLETLRVQIKESKNET